MGKRRLLIAMAAALALSACGMFSGMGDDRSERGGAYGDGGDTGTRSEAVAECKGLTGTALQNCLDRQGLKRAPEPSRPERSD